MSAPNVTPYVVVPRAVYDARDAGDFDLEHLHIFLFGYLTADRKQGYRVHSYSAERVCRFWGLDATKANLARYKRAAHELVERRLIHRDYRRLDPERTNHTGRTYSIWLPRPSRFQFVGSPAENATNLWGPAQEGQPKDASLFVSAFVPLLDRDNVPLPDAVTNADTATSGQEHSDNVPLVREPDVPSLFVPNQDFAKPAQSEREIPLNPPSGDFSPAPLPLKGENTPAVGLTATPAQNTGNTNGTGPRLTARTGKVRPAGNGRALSAAQCEQLDKVALLYADFSVWLYDFSPDVKHVRALLKDFTPRELLFAQIQRFGMWNGAVPKNSMGHFFWKSAHDAIKAARIKGTSTSEPEAFKVSVHGKPNAANAARFHEHWAVVKIAWTEFKQGSSEKPMPTAEVQPS